MRKSSILARVGTGGWLAVLLILATPAVHAASKRMLELDDLHRLRTVGDPQISPDGEWVAYTVRTPDLEADRQNIDLWMTRWDGSRSVQLTYSKEKERTPRWSPDGRYLGFLSPRKDKRSNGQLWLLDRTGGEARKLTDFKGGVSDFAWAPDGKRLVLVVSDPDPDALDAEDNTDKPKTRKPIVIDRFQFKQDKTEYLRRIYSHLVLYDLERRQSEPLTSGTHDELLPAWSPDGRSIAFASKRGADPDRHDNWDLYVIQARAGSRARQLTTFDGPDNAPSFGSRPAWSPDGGSISYTQGGPQKLIYYAVQHLAVIPAAGGAAKLPAPDLDRNVQEPRWSADGRFILFLLEEDRRVQLAKVPASGGNVELLLDGPQMLSRFTQSRNGRIAVLRSTAHEPAEVFALESGELRPLSRQNEALLSELRLGAMEEISFASEDSTIVNGFVVKPPRYRAGKKYPTILRIHGGPVWQYYNEFHFDFQLFAAHGYAVVVANPRGSSGRGEEYQMAIYADWGNKDTQDVLAAVDYLVAQGIADPDRLGVGGWSYGGILTNYVIAQDTRFKAATSGSSISNLLAGYGTDQYIRAYENELGPPWENLDTWLRLSFPFLKANRIRTPTLFMCGEKDFNVPLLNSEQMYQALRSVGVDTQLVIYPGQYHGISTPSYRRDRLERYLAWYDKYLKP